MGVSIKVEGEKQYLTHGVAEKKRKKWEPVTVSQRQKLKEIGPNACQTGIRVFS